MVEKDYSNIHFDSLPKNENNSLRLKGKIKINGSREGHNIVYLNLPMRQEVLYIEGRRITDEQDKFLDFINKILVKEKIQVVNANYRHEKRIGILFPSKLEGLAYEEN